MSPLNPRNFEFEMTRVLSQVVAVFIAYNKTSVIMASGRELCYVLLMGILASYMVPFFALARPNVFSCAILR